MHVNGMFVKFTCIEMLQEGRDTYSCDTNGRDVFTILFHLRRDKCCGQMFAAGYGSGGAAALRLWRDG